MLPRYFRANLEEQQISWNVTYSNHSCPLIFFLLQWMTSGQRVNYNQLTSKSTAWLGCELGDASPQLSVIPTSCVYLWILSLFLSNRPWLAGLLVPLLVTPQLFLLSTICKLLISTFKTALFWLKLTLSKSSDYKCFWLVVMHLPGTLILLLVDRFVAPSE